MLINKLIYILNYLFIVYMFELLNKLPNDILNHIFNYISPTTLIFLNKTLLKNNYSNYFDYIYPVITNYNSNTDKYIKGLLRNDKHLLLDLIVNKYFKKFITFKNYRWGNMRFGTYYHYLIYISKYHYKSTKCNNILKNTLVLNGMNKNKYKKIRIYNNNRWTN